METINVADARSRFSELISRTASGEHFVIQRREKSVAVLISPGEFENLEQAARNARHLALALGQDAGLLERIDRGESHPAMAGYGLMKDDDSFEMIIKSIIEARRSSAARPVIDL